MRYPRVGRHAVTALGLVMLFVLLPGIPAALANGASFALRQGTLYAPAPQSQAHFGQSVAVSGETAIVGQPDFHAGAPVANVSAGAVDVFVRSGGAWVFQQELLPPVLQEGTGYGSAVAIDGNVLVVGAPSYTIAGKGATGAAFVYRRSGTKWTLEKTLTGSGVTDTERFGAAVAIDGSTIVVGAPNDDGHGSAWPYRHGATGWVSQGKLVDNYPSSNDQFGASVAIEGDTLMVGEPGDDNGEEAVPFVDAGALFRFTRSSTTWTLRQVITPPDQSAHSGFAGPLAMSGGRVLVGSMEKTVGGLSGAGKAYVFADDGTSWVFETSLTAPVPTADSYFGSSVALDGRTALIGEFFASAYHGRAHFFTELSGAWTIRQTLDLTGETPQVTQLGTSVGLSNGTAVLGAQMSNSPTVSLAGAAFVFSTRGILTGIVRDAVSGLTISGIEMSAYFAGQIEPDVLAGLMNTDSHGRYKFALDGGDYALGWMDEQRRYKPGFYDHGIVWPDATTVTVSTGTTTTIDLSLQPKPHVTLTRPVTGFTWVSKNHRFTAYGYLKPRHPARSYPVKLYCYRYQRIAGGRSGWVLRKTVSAKAYDYRPRVGSIYTKYSATLSLPYTGKWRIRAYNAPDEDYAPTYSDWRYFTVR